MKATCCPRQSGILPQRRDGCWGQNQRLGRGTRESLHDGGCTGHTTISPKPYCDIHIISLPMMALCTRGCVFQECSRWMCCQRPHLACSLDPTTLPLREGVFVSSPGSWVDFSDGLTTSVQAEVMLRDFESQVTKEPAGSVSAS